jgi:lysophospholipase L1-like esterase
MIENTSRWLSSGDRLVCFGDSLTESSDGYVSHLIRELLPRRVDVISSGLGGDKTLSALLRMSRDVMAHNPTAVFLFFGANDARVGRGKWADEPVVSPTTYRECLIWMVHLCRQAGVKKISIAPPIWRLEGDEWRENGDIYQPYCLAARAASEASGSRFVPLDIAFAEEWQRHPGHNGLLMTLDGIHPTAAGHALIASTCLSAWRL